MDTSKTVNEMPFAPVFAKINNYPVKKAAAAPKSNN